METYPSELLLIVFAALLAPLLAGLPKNFRLPVVVVEIVLGVLIGPNGFALATPDGIVSTLSELGLTFLLFMVGLEIDFDRIRGRPLTLAINGWFLSFFVALMAMYFFSSIGLIETPPLLAAVALSTTALGVIIPILRDRSELNTNFGTYLMAAAAVGEFGPLIVISVLLIPTHSTILHTSLVLTFVIIAILVADLAIYARSAKWIDMLGKSMHSSGQLPVRICLLLQVLLVTLAQTFGLNIVLGAFVAGMIVKLALKNAEEDLLLHKLDAIGYGFLIPIFFIVAGMKFDVSALWSAPMAPIQVVLLSALLLLVRGVPLFLYRDALSSVEKLPFAFYSATGLPLIVIISEIGVDSGLMSPDRASILVSAGMMSVLAFPILAEKVREKYTWPW